MFTLIALIALQLIGQIQSIATGMFKINAREPGFQVCGTNLTLHWRYLCYDSNYAPASNRYFQAIPNDYENLFNESPESPYVRVLNYECCEVGCSDNWIWFWYCKKPANYENPLYPGFSVNQCYDSQRNCYARGRNCHEYYGNKNRTLSGLTCQYWNSQTPHTHNWGPYTQETDNNYCRRFNSTSPWCFITTWNKVWEFCFEECKCYDSESDCYSQLENCEGYFGNKSTTIDGLTCQKWSSQTPHTHDFGPFDNHNYCRSISSRYSKVPSCLTTSPDKAIGSCIKPCESGCYNPITNCYRNVPSCYDYAGIKAVTVSGKTCQAWKDQTPHTHETHPDEEKNKNYCRRYSMNVPWCYTTDPIIRHEPCFFHCDQLKEVVSAARDYRECFQAGQFFYSTWRNSSYGLLAVVQVNTSRRCYQACRANSGCEYWSYLPTDYLNVPKGCYLRVYRGGSMRWKSAVSGPRDCDNSSDPYRAPDHNCIPFGNTNEGFLIVNARRLHVPTGNSRDYTMENIQKFIPYKPFEEGDAEQLKMLQLKVSVERTFRLYLFPNVAFNAEVVELLRDLNVEDAFKNAILVDIDFASDSKTIKMNQMTNRVWRSPKTFSSWRLGSFDEGTIDEIFIQFKKSKLAIFVHALGNAVGLSYHVDTELTNPSWIQQLSNIWFWSDSPTGTKIFHMNQCTDGRTIDLASSLTYKLNVLPNFTMGSPPLKINYVILYGFMKGTLVGNFDIKFQYNNWDNANTVLQIRGQYNYGKLIFFRNARIEGEMKEEKEELSLIDYADDTIVFARSRGVESFTRFDFMFLEHSVNVAFMGKIIFSFYYRSGYDARRIVSIFVDMWSSYDPTHSTDTIGSNFFYLHGIDLQNAEYDDKLTKIHISTPLPEGIIRYLNYTPVTTTPEPVPEPETNQIFISNHEAGICFENRVFYYNWWAEGQLIATVQQVDATDYFNCYRACRESKTCQFWSFVEKDNQGVGTRCYLRTSTGGTMRLLNAVSGPKDCRNPGCPFGWSQNGNSCYFLLPGKFKNQSTAAAACRALNPEANLPVFRDRAEWSDFDAEFLRFNLRASQQQLWLAGDDKVFEGKFFFQQSTERNCEIDFLNFGPGQPDGFRHENCLIRLVQSNEYSDAPCDIGAVTPSMTPGAVCQIRGNSFCDKQDYKQAPPIKSCQELFNLNGRFNYLRHVSRAKYVPGELRFWSYKDVPKLIPFKPQLIDENQLNLLQIHVDVGDSMTFLFMENASINNKTVELVKQGNFEDAFKNYIRLDFHFQFEDTDDRSMAVSVANEGAQTEIKKISRWRTNNIFTKWEIDVILIRFLADKIKFYIHGEQTYLKGLREKQNYMLELFEVDKPSWFDKMENIWHIGASESFTTHLFHCTSGVQVEQDQSRAFTYDFGDNFHALTSGDPPHEANYVALYGYPSGAPDGNFQIHFLPSNNPDQNTVFTFSVRFWEDDSHVVRNAKFNGEWGEDETDMVKDKKEFPFLSESFGNQNLTRMDFMFKETEINVAVNGYLFCTFAYRNGLNRQTIKSLKIERGPKDSDDTSTDGHVGYELFGIDVKYVEYGEAADASRKINPDEKY